MRAVFEKTMTERTDNTIEAAYLSNLAAEDSPMYERYAKLMETAWTPLRVVRLPWYKQLWYWLIGAAR